MRSALVITVAISLTAGCGAEPLTSGSPTAPSSAGRPGVVSAAPTEEPRTVVLPLGGQPIGPADVTFPPRNEPLLFRNALESKYRDGLRRTATPSFVDQEGTVVWVQEYLRYRVNLCPHAEAVARVFRQIDGQGIQPACGSTSTVIFPPRGEPLDFMVQLEAKYRDSLRRPPQQSFVDVEGNVIWTQEYLRYRVGGCAHNAAQERVFAQIDGRGLQPDCISDGTFDGRTSLAGAISLSVSGGSITRVVVTVNGPSCRVTSTYSAFSRPISGNTFSFTFTSTTSSLALTGQFDSPTVARGSVVYSFFNPSCLISNASFTWTATRTGAAVMNLDLAPVSYKVEQQ